jgi:hypothetical protein
MSLRAHANKAGVAVIFEPNYKPDMMDIRRTC